MALAFWRPSLTPDCLRCAVPRKGRAIPPDAGATWLLTEIDPDDHDHAFGLCDLGLGAPEIGWVSLGELATVRGGLGLPIERDLSFRAEKRLSAYARDARLAGRIAV